MFENDVQHDTGERLARVETLVELGTEQRREMIKDIKATREDVATLRATFEQHIKDDAKMAGDIHDMKAALDEVLTAAKSVKAERDAAKLLVKILGWVLAAATTLFAFGDKVVVFFTHTKEIIK